MEGVSIIQRLNGFFSMNKYLALVSFCHSMNMNSNLYKGEIKRMHAKDCNQEVHIFDYSDFRTFLLKVFC